MARSATILAYHAIGECPHRERAHNCLCISTETFAKQMSFLAKSRQVVSLEDVVEGRFSGRRPAVAITFDDGYRNILTNAAPILNRYGFAATMFVPTKWIGQRYSWDAGTDCFPFEIADEDDLRRAARLGIVVESHGHAHIDLGRADPLIAAEDLQMSFVRLREILGRQPRYLAYPYGRQSPATWASAAEAGFSHAFLFDGVEAGKLAHERVSVDGREGRVRLRVKTAGGYLARRHSRLGSATASITRLAFPKAHIPAAWTSLARQEDAQ
jgi:peptidoglycan/xylan/chitin deacetylase (PgdA/CDA1 family)